MILPRCTLALSSILGLALAALGCGGDSSSTATQDRSEPEPPYLVSTQGGTPATGPAPRYNHCERIWCQTHGENFFIDHFLAGHVGWILHDDDFGDLYSPSRPQQRPPFPQARRTVLALCGKHVHPYRLGRGGGPVLHTGFNASLGYRRSHFSRYGTRLEPCCINGLGSAYVHTRADRTFRFHDLAFYRSHPEWGWQRPFQARTTAGDR